VTLNWGLPGAIGAKLASPVEDRVRVLTKYWRIFDEIHGRQSSGMPSLWGLVEEGRGVRIGWEGPDWYNPRLYEEMLPKDLQDAIKGLWGTVMLPRWPDRIVTESAPHALMAETFGGEFRLPASGV
jgi:hypothetical protein